MVHFHISTIHNVFRILGICGSLKISGHVQKCAGHTQSKKILQDFKMKANFTMMHTHKKLSNKVIKLFFYYLNETFSDFKSEFLAFFSITNNS